ncbi:MAG: NAD(P)/FAD-dependent oxidoreductase [Planctomycetota bacterium]
MKIILEQLLLPLEYNNEDIYSRSAEVCKINRHDIKDIRIIKRSIDARKRRTKPAYILNLEVSLTRDINVKSIKNAKSYKEPEIYSIPETRSNNDRHRPVVVGAGPCGLSAGYILAKAGLKPILIERGSCSEERKAAVTTFWKNGKLDEENNVLYGEGGAGLFSDGKLTSRSKDKRRTLKFFDILIEAGAPENIRYDSDAHLGSDKLFEICINLRKIISNSGGEFLFDTRLIDISSRDGCLKKVETTDSELKTEHCILATGHSARDTYLLLHKNNIALEQKPFAIGVRIEIPQCQINSSQYGSHRDHPLLGAASFRLTNKADSKNRSCYTFCMCPGGIVIPCSSSGELITTNGMSFSERNGKYGNAAFLVPVFPEDYNVSDCPLDGLNFQNNIEKAAFAAAGSDYSLPAVKLTDFLSDKKEGVLPRGREMSWKRSKFADFNNIFPEFITENLRKSIPEMLKFMNNVKLEEITAYAPETRSSSPVRIIRNNSMQSNSVSGLYPCGEGSGYSGGIVSSAIDGIKAAEEVIKKYL